MQMTGVADIIENAVATIRGKNPQQTDGEWLLPIASEAVSAMDSPLSGSRYHFSYHSGPSRYQFQTSLLLRLHRSIPSLITAIFL